MTLTEVQKRDAYEAAHPAVRRRREAREQMTQKVHDFLDIPAKLPVRALTPAERAIQREARLVGNLAEHMRWRAMIPVFQSQPSIWYGMAARER